MLLVNKDLH